MSCRGIEPRPIAWKATILTIRPTAHNFSLFFFFNLHVAILHINYLQNITEFHRPNQSCNTYPPTTSFKKLKL